AFIMPVNAAMRKGIGKGRGEKIKVEIEADNRALALNKEFLTCLADEPAAMQFFKTLPKSQQLYFSKWIDGTKTDGTKAKRIGQAVNGLARKLNYPMMIRNLKNKN